MLSSPLRAYLVVGGMEVTLGRILRGTLDPNGGVAPTGFEPVFLSCDDNGSMDVRPCCAWIHGGAARSAATAVLVVAASASDARPGASGNGLAIPAGCNR